MVDENLPRPAPELTEDGVPAIDELPVDVLTGDPLEGELPPLDRPQAVTTWGTTASEQLAAEPDDVRAQREQPETESYDTYLDRPFLEPGADGGLGDNEADLVGEVDTGFADTLSAEEAAMRVVDEPPGMNYDATPGYLDNE